ncbi:MAG: DUF2142 domain-containing protein [Bacilli bacterium]|nr:DUF2142 domain-containing protein [Bacilli bacterium]
MKILNNKKTQIVLYVLSIIALLAFNYIRVGRMNIFLFIFEFVVSAILLFALFKLKKIKIENLFLLIGIPLAILYMFSSPFCKVPDEMSHYARSYAISEGDLLSDIDKNGNAYVTTPGINKVCKVESYDNYFKALTAKNKNEKTVHSNTALYNFIIYIPQTLGVLVSKIFNLSMPISIYLSRLFNLICYLTLIYFSIKLIPYFKEFIILIALNPMALQEGASLSADSITIGISIFFISYIFYLYSKKEEKLSKKEFVILLITSLVCSLSKIVYVPLCLLPILLPKTKFKNGKDKIIKVLVLILIPIILNLIWLKFASKYLVVFQPGVDTPNQVKYVLKQPFTYIVTILRTIQTYGVDYIESLFGGKLNLFNVPTGRFYVYMTLLITIIMLLVYRFSDKTNCIKRKITYLFLLLSIILLIFTSLYVQWTPLKKNVINGVQGRYFLPIMLLLPFICLKSNKKGKIFNIDMEFCKKLLFIFLIFQNLNAIISIVITYI